MSFGAAAVIPKGYGGISPHHCKRGFLQSKKSPLLFPGDPLSARCPGKNPAYLRARGSLSGPVSPVTWTQRQERPRSWTFWRIAAGSIFFPRARTV